MGQTPMDQPPPRWADRTTTDHHHDGHRWELAVTWANRPDGTRVPASITLTSMDDEPQAVTRSVIESIPWSTAIWESATAIKNHPLTTDWNRMMGVHHLATTTEERLALVARLYRDLGGESKGIAQRVHRALVDMGVQPDRRGRQPDHPEGDGTKVLTETRVRAWIQECRKRGLLPPAARSKPRTTR